MNYTRGQIAGQIFIFIAGMIIIGMIVLLGVRIFSNTNKTSENYVSIDFQKQVNSDAHSLVGSYGSSVTKKYSLPTGFNEICFVNQDLVKTADISSYPIIQDSVSSGSDNNVFLIGPKGFGAFYSPDLNLVDSPYFSCVSVTNGLDSVTFISFGDSVSIKATAYKKYCQNAQDANLCNGLDITFGPGYLAECQSKYNLCI